MSSPGLNFLNVLILSKTLSVNGWPPHPGFTVISRTISSSFKSFFVFVSFCKRLDLILRVVYHQMDVLNQPCIYALYNIRAESNSRDKLAVHHVKMKHINIRL